MLLGEVLTLNVEPNTVHYFFIVKAAETSLKALKQRNTGNSGMER